MASATAALRRQIDRALPDRPVTIELWDGTSVPATRPGPTLTIHSPRALGHLLRAPGELGLGRAYVCGEIDVDDLDGVIALLGRWSPPPLGLGPRLRFGAAVLRAPGWHACPRPPPPSSSPRRRRHTQEPRRRGGAPPLQRLERVLRPVPGSDDDLQLRAVRGRGRDARGRPARQARADLSQAGAASPECGCSTSGAVGEASRSTRRASTGPWSGGSRCPSPRPSWPASEPGRPGLPIGSRSASWTTETCPRTPSTRWPASAWSSTSASRGSTSMRPGSPGCWRRAAGC